MRFPDGTEPDGSIALSWVEGWMPADTECWRQGRSDLASAGSCCGPITTASRVSLRGPASPRAHKPSRRARWYATGT